MNGRNRSRRTSRKTTIRTADSPRFHQRRLRYDRQRHASGQRCVLPWQLPHRYNVCLSVGGCY